MPLSWVKVEGPDDRDVYLEGNPIDPAGRTNSPFRVQMGKNNFQLIRFIPDSDPIVEAEKEVVVDLRLRNDPLIVPLWPATGAPPPPEGDETV